MIQIKLFKLDDKKLKKLDKLDSEINKTIQIR